MTNVKIQCHRCKHCNKTFQMDLISFVDKNSNFTNEFKSESDHSIF